MAYTKHDAMEKLICEVLYRGRTAPATYYLGLGHGTVPPESGTMADVIEVSGPGYSRVAFSKGVIDFPDLIKQDGDWKVGSLLKTFTNSGGADWTQADYAFLSSSPNAAGDASGELFASVTFPGFIVFDGNHFDAIYEYQDS